MLKLIASVVVPIGVCRIVFTVTHSLFVALMVAMFVFVLIQLVKTDTDQPQAPQTTALATKASQQRTTYHVVDGEQQPVAGQPQVLVDTSTVTGEQMYYKEEQKLINESIDPFGFHSNGKPLIRSRAVVYPLTFSRTKTGGKFVKTKAEQIEEHIMSLTVIINDLRNSYGYAPATVMASYNPFVLIVSSIHQQPLAWSTLPSSEVMQARLGLSVTTADQAPIIWDISDDEDEYFSMLIGGIPKAGKTTLMRSILLQLCREMSPTQLQLHIVENPKGDFKQLRSLPHVASYVKSNEAVSLLQRVSDELCQGEPDETRPYHVVVVDEIQRYALDPAYREKFLPLVKQILSVGRALRIRLMLATPRPSAEMLSNDVMELIQMRVAGKLGPAGSRIILGSDNADKLTAKGAFILKRDGIETMFYAYHLTNDDISTEIEVISQKYSHRMDLSSIKPVQVEEIRFEGMVIPPELLEAVKNNWDSTRNKIKHGVKEQIIEELLGESKGSTGQRNRRIIEAAIKYYAEKFD